MNITKARHDLLARFSALKHDTRTGGELTVRTNPQPSRAVRMPDPRPTQETMTALCETLHAVQAQNRVLAERLAALEQGKARQETTLVAPTTARNAMEQSAPAWLTINVTKPRTQSNVRPCPMGQAKAQPDTGSYGNGQPSSSRCPLAHGYGSDYSGNW